MIGKAAWSDYKKNISLKLSLTATYIFILACVIMLAVLFPFSFIITVPFIVLPFTVSYIGALEAPAVAGTLPIRSFFIFYPVYYSPIFFGGFRALLGLLKSILISIAFSSVLTLILYFTYLKNQPGFAEILHEIQNATSASAIETAINHFFEFEPAKFVSQISNLVGGFFGIWTFIRHCLLNSEKIIFNLVTPKPLPIKALNRLHVSASHARRKEFFKEYFGATWYVILWFILVFGGGASLSMFVFKLDSTTSLMIGLFAAIVLSFPFIPYYFDVMKNICLASTDDYQKASIYLSEKALVDLERRGKLTEEDRKKLQKQIEQGKAALKQIEEEEKKAQEEENKK